MDGCAICGKDRRTGEGCICERVALKTGAILSRLRHAGSGGCPGCGVNEDELHHFHCPHEVCPACEGLLLECGCL
jgi:hypothetical protein